MHLDEFHALSADDARRVVAVWAPIPRWVETLVAGRPYRDVAELGARARAEAAHWNEDDLDAALAHHPRIGARVDEPGAEGDASRSEQAAMRSASDDDAAAIAAGNRRYEERFDRVFLIRAAGRTPGEMRAELERRLGNDDRTETAEALGQLAEIALLRLSQTVTAEAPA
jgi:2-oxo-4-hydroxy-4-carboxy-5-ureidoimidazoline decarboxylase